MALEKIEEQIHILFGSPRTRYGVFERSNRQSAVAGSFFGRVQRSGYFKRLCVTPANNAKPAKLEHPRIDPSPFAVKVINYKTWALKPAHTNNFKHFRDKHLILQKCHLTNQSTSHRFTSLRSAGVA